MNIEFRLDFLIEVLSSDEKSGTIKFALKPNPKRYEQKKIEGKKYLFDKFDNVLIEEEMLYKAIAEQLEGKPINLQQQEIGDIDDYIRERIPAIDATLDASTSQPYEFIDKSEEFLASQEKNTLEFAIVSIDIAASTKLATSIEHEKYLKIVKIYINEMSRLIPKFHGYILKFTGDGLLAYFPAPSLIRMNDLALDCSLCIRRLVYNCLNPIFSKHNLPQIQIRIGIDSGEASIVELGGSLSKSQKDIIGGVINIATKVQSAAEPNDVLLGHSAVRLLHAMYREGVEEFETKPDWPYKTSEKEKYKVFKVKDKASFSL
jgi:class 3 adenylate cyclase